MVAAIDEAVGRLQRLLREGNYDYDLFYEVLATENETTYVIRIIHRSGKKTPENFSPLIDIADSSFAKTLKALKGVNVGEQFGKSDIKLSNGKYRGVESKGHKFAARISRDGRKISLGSYPTPKEAALAYNEAAKRLRGESAVLNEV